MGNRATSQGLIDLGNRIRKQRQQAHLSQEALAELAEISPNTVSRIEGGQTAMSVEVFQRLVCAGHGCKLPAWKLRPVTGQDGSGQLREMFWRVQYLKKGEQKIVLQTMAALMDGLESR